MRGKKPLSSNEVKSLRKLLEDKPLHSLLLNIGVDTMLRGSDLLKGISKNSFSVKKVQVIPP